jgi:MinD-like ATPase involved in chromosome partitioning or flagellar assembly
MPSAVTVPRPSPPLDRARASWQETDYLRRLDEAIATPRLRRCATIAVVSPKGGVGKTTITALLGSLLAYTRRDRAVAVDTNPDYGSLGRMLTPGHEVFVDDLLDLLKGSELTATQLDARLGRGPDGLLVLPAPTQPSRMARLDRNAYQSVIEYLKTKAGVLLLDCGTGLQEPAAQAAIFTADQLLLVSDAEPATATLVAEASGQLFKSGVPVMLVVNKVTRRGVRLDLESLERLVPDASGMATLDAQPAAAGRVAASTFTWRDPAGRWEESVRQLAVALVSQWDGLGLTAHEARAGLPK